jgi:nitronate monooxygenase
VQTNATASPTGFPFKVARLKGSLSELSTYKERNRICDLGYLRTSYRQEDGKVGYRCPSEPVEDYLKKGGTEADTVGRMCVCNGLFGTIGMPQVRKDGFVEPSLVTAGDDLVKINEFLPKGATHYTAKHVIEVLTSKLKVGVS